MPKHQALIDVIQLSDIAQHKNCSEAEGLGSILQIIQRLKKPRVYACEPFGPLGPANQKDLWDDSRDVLVSQLIQNKCSVIDPLSLWTLIVAHPPLKQHTSHRNPLLLRLMMSGCLDEIYLADEKYSSLGRIQRTAELNNIRMHTWTPTIDICYRTDKLL